MRTRTRSTVLLDKLTVAQLLNKFPAISGTWMFITLLQKVITEGIFQTARCYKLLNTWSLDISAVFWQVVNKVVCSSFNDKHPKLKFKSLTFFYVTLTCLQGWTKPPVSSKVDKWQDLYICEHIYMYSLLICTATCPRQQTLMSGACHVTLWAGAVRGTQKCLSVFLCSENVRIMRKLYISTICCSVWVWNLVLL
jgi:hypothetical protein